MPINLTDEQLSRIDQALIEGNSEKALDLIIEYSGASAGEAAPLLTSRLAELREKPEHAHLKKKQFTTEQSAELEKKIVAGHRDEAVHLVQKWTGKSDEEAEAVVQAHELLIKFKESHGEKPGGGWWPFGKQKKKSDQPNRD